MFCAQAGAFQQPDLSVADFIFVREVPNEEGVAQKALPAERHLVTLNLAKW